MTSMTMTKRVARHTTLALAITAVSACSTDVTNPGPIQAGFLDNKNALAAIVNGAGRNLAEALNWTSYTSAAISRELHPAGSTGSFGITSDCTPIPGAHCVSGSRSRCTTLNESNASNNCARWRLESPWACTWWTLPR